MNVLVTGATGFVGSCICNDLLKHNISFRRVIRRKVHNDDLVMKDISNVSDWSHALIGINIIIHAAARVHIMNDSLSDPLSEYRKINVAGTLNLATQAAAAGIKRFVFISSIKVNGESTSQHQTFKPDYEYIPTDPYGLSKYEAEMGLAKIAEQTGMEIVIIRPPLVYGAGVKANFASLLKLVKKGYPLPFGLVNSNRRSMVSVYNLVDLIINCVSNPKAANQVFLVSDDDDISTAGLIKHMATAMDCSSRLLPVPMWLFRVVGRLTGRFALINRLVGSLRVDITHTKETLGWKPPYTVSESMKLTVQSDCTGS